MTILRADPLLAIPVPLPLPAQLKPVSRRVSPLRALRAAPTWLIAPPEWERRMRPRGSSLNVSGSSARSSDMPMSTVFAIVIAAIGIAIPIINVMRDKVLVALVGDGGRPEMLW
jgi:hypothetical protein